MWVGVTAGLQSALMTVCLYGVEDLFRKLPIHWMWWPALGAVVVGVGGWLDPAVLSVGYDNIHALLNGTMDVHATAALLIGKATVWIVALSSGTSGGVLAPLLIIGGSLGSLEAHFLPFGDTGFWALLGMAAILGGTMRAPLTATMFAFELTDNIHVLPALFIASLAAFLATVLLMRRSILTERIARRGLHLRAGAHEQRVAEGGAQPRQRCAGGGLAQAHGLGRAVHAAQPRQCLEHHQQVQVDRTNIHAVDFMYPQHRLFRCAGCS